MAVSGSLWTILLPGTKNKATIEVLAEHLGEETVRETTTYAPSASLVSRSKFSKFHFGEVSDKSPGCGDTVWQFGKLL